MDGDPIPASGRAAQPEARISAVSVSFRRPVDDGNGGWLEGDRVDYAWPFDQGPLIGKPGTPIKDPETGVCTFKLIDRADQERLLAAHAKALGREVTLADAAPNLPASEYAKLVGWIDRRDYLIAHNSVHDFHQFRAGLRAGAGGDPAVPEGFAAWDADSEPGQWRLGQPQRLHMMEPSLEPLVNVTTRRQVWCTMVTQKQLIDPLHPAALKPTGRRLWGDDSTNEEVALKAELSKQGTGLTKRYDLLPWCGAVGRYAAADTALTHRLHEYQVNAADEGAVLPRFWQLYEAEMELRTTLYRMERRAVAYAADESMAEGAKLRAQNVEAAKRMPFDPTKINQAKRFYYGPVCSQANVVQTDPWENGHPKFCATSCHECGGKNGLGLEPTSRTEKTQAPQLDINELRRLVDEGQPWAAEYMAWTKRRNSDSKWYTGWAARTGRDGRIRTSFKQCRNDRERPGAAEGGAKSGRLAVGRWQAQAIPHSHLIPEGATPVRKLIGQVPAGTRLRRFSGEEYVTPVRRFQAEHDLAAGEIRVVTVIANSTRLWDALDEGADTHAMNTTALFGVGADHPQFKDLRNAAKRATFGILYGGGVNAIHTQVEAASGMRFSKQAVKEAKDRFFETYPEFRRFADQAEQRVTRWQGGCGYLKMLDGWRRWYDPTERSTSAVNQVIQGNLARAMMYWMAEVERRVPGCLLLQIHDSLVTEHDDTPEGRAEMQLVSDIGNEVFERYFNVRNRVMRFNIAPELWDEKS